MEKKSFIIFLTILILTLTCTVLLKYHRPQARPVVTLDSLALSNGQWQGEMAPVSKSVKDLLCPDGLFSAIYKDHNNNEVQVFIDYYLPKNTSGAIHSPHNCLPGSGWIIARSSPRQIIAGNRQIEANRIWLNLGETRQVMDYWYITRYGETANDFRLKLNTMISSLILRPTDKAFVRFITADNTQSIEAMENFEAKIIDDIYRHLPF